MFMKERPNQQRLLPSLKRICKLTYQTVNTPLCYFDSMGLGGLRDRDNVQFFDAKKPLVVVYYEVDYDRNPKGKTVLVVEVVDK